MRQKGFCVVSWDIDEGWSEAAINSFGKEPINEEAFKDLIALLGPGLSRSQRDDLRIAIGYACGRKKYERESGHPAVTRVSKKRFLNIATKPLKRLMSFAPP